MAVPGPGFVTVEGTPAPTPEMSEVTLSLNVGCGDDPIGDVRVDAFKSHKGVRRLLPPTIYASIYALPFRDHVFSWVKCSHLLEHLEHVREATLELLRVGNCEMELRFPRDGGWFSEIVLEATSLNLNGVRLAILTRRMREHKWIIHPKYVQRTLNGWSCTVMKGYKIPARIRFISEGRKGKLWRWFFGHLPVWTEWRMLCKTQGG